LTREQLQEALGEDVLSVDSHSVADLNAKLAPMPSPGMLSRHYAPTVSLECVASDAWQRVQELCRSGTRLAWLAWNEVPREQLPGLIVTVMPLEPAAYSA